MVSAVNDNAVDQEGNFGDVRFATARLDENVLVALKSVHGLKPRPGKDEVNFSLDISVISNGTGNCCETRSTEVFKKQAFKLFDLQGDEDYAGPDSHNQDTFQFCLDEAAFGRRNAHKLAPFIQICLFDHSVTMSNKIFRGVAFMSCQEVPPITRLDQLFANDGSQGLLHKLKFSPMPKLGNDEENDIFWKELKSRSSHDSAAKHFVRDHNAYANESRIPTLF